MKNEILDFIIPEWALCAIVNGDYSALNDTEIAAVKKHIEQYGDTASINGERFFSHRNDLTGYKGSMCYDMAFLQVRE